jgi:DNA-binding NtrC family response regulator
VESDGKRACVLFVDDDERITQMAEQVLRDASFEVAALTRSLDALAAFRADPSRFDVIVLDQTMPQLSGLELAAQISAIRRELPIVLLSGMAESLAPRALEQAGVHTCLPKPLRLSRLAEVVRALLATSDDE